MTVNVEGLINSLGSSYRELTDNGLITYKSPPSGFPGDPDLSLDMAKEGLFLSFKRNGRVLQAIVLTIQDERAKNWIFPNKLPSPLQKKMTRQWVHENVGEPLRSIPPQVVMKKHFGWTDLYDAEGYSTPTSMQINYDIMDNVRAVTFIPTSELRW